MLYEQDWLLLNFPINTVVLVDQKKLQNIQKLQKKNISKQSQDNTCVWYQWYLDWGLKNVIS